MDFKKLNFSLTLLDPLEIGGDSYTNQLSSLMLISGAFLFPSAYLSSPVCLICAFVPLHSDLLLYFLSSPLLLCFNFFDPASSVDVKFTKHLLQTVTNTTWAGFTLLSL